MRINIHIILYSLAVNSTANYVFMYILQYHLLGAVGLVQSL